MYKINKQKGAGGIGFILIILLVVLFLLWLRSGGPENKESTEKPFFQAEEGQVVPDKVLPN